MEIQIKGIWYNVPDFDEFYNTIEVGDIVTLVLEPENICESEAIAVYYRYKRIGYVKSSELQSVHDIMDNRNKLKVPICYKYIDTEEPKNNELDFSLNAPEDSSLLNWKRYKQRDLQNLLGNLKISTLVELEIGIELIIDDIIEAMDIAFRHDVGSRISDAAIEHIIDISQIYIENSHNSLSAQCTQSVSAICKRIKILEQKFPSYSMQLHEIYLKLKIIDSKFSHTDFIVDIYDRQIEAFISECSIKNGFFDKYCSMYLNNLNNNDKHTFLCNKINELHSWFENLPEGLGWFFFNDKSQFCSKLKYAKYGYKDLYTIYTNIALFGFLLEQKQYCPKQDDYKEAKIISQCLILIQNNNINNHIDQASITNSEISVDNVDTMIKDQMNLLSQVNNK